MGSQSDRSEPHYRRRAPAAALAGLVSGIHGYEERGDALQGVVETASLDVPLIINFGSPYRIGLGRSPTQDDRYRSFAAGLFAGPVIMDSEGDAQCIQVNFTPLGGRLFFARPMSDLANCMVSLDDMGDREIDEIAVRLAELNSWEARLDVVERFIAMRLARAAAIDPSIEWALGALMRSGGQIRIGTIAQKLDWSRRRLVERFREEVGLPPKAVGAHRSLQCGADHGPENGRTGLGRYRSRLRLRRPAASGARVRRACRRIAHRLAPGGVTFLQDRAGDGMRDRRQHNEGVLP
jgi:AraC-like DNA-binding protein